MVKVELELDDDFVATLERVGKKHNATLEETIKWMTAFGLGAHVSAMRGLEEPTGTTTTNNIKVDPEESNKLDKVLEHRQQTLRDKYGH